VRSATKTFVGLAGIGVLVATAKLGLPTATAAAATTTATTSTTTTDTTSQQPATTTTSTSTTPSTSTSTKATTTTKKTTKKSTSSSSSSSSSSTTTTTTTPAATSASQTSGQVGYRFGTIQLKVTKASGKITDVTCVVCGATGGRQQAFPTLIQAAIDANGSNFGNLGGASYTTAAFKQALDGALAKF